MVRGLPLMLVMVLLLPMLVGCGGGGGGAPDESATDAVLRDLTAVAALYDSGRPEWGEAVAAAVVAWETGREAAVSQENGWAALHLESALWQWGRARTASDPVFVANHVRMAKERAQRAAARKEGF